MNKRIARGSDGAAAENHYSNVVPRVRPRSQISDSRKNSFGVFLSSDEHAKGVGMSFKLDVL